MKLLLPYIKEELSFQTLCPLFSDLVPSEVGLFWAGLRM